jgi:hypothetical protein
MNTAGRASQLCFASTASSVILAYLAGEPRNLLRLLAAKCSAISIRDVVEVGVAALATALTFLVSRRYPVFSARVVGRFRSSANLITPSILAAMFLPLALRLALLPWLPPPEPRIHDEFGHLLVADTLAAGRLANPPHPLWRHLETMYVLQQPTYSSIYPIGNGIILAVGRVLTGTPWAGVLLSVMLMCGGTSWMLFGCLPPKWAALGGVLAALHYGLAKQWLDSYWGGAFCAFGGALLFGALYRLRGSPSRTLALLVGLGWSIVWLIRPFESLLLLIISLGSIAAFVIGNPRLWRRWIGPIALILTIQISAGCVTALHNRAVTGSFANLPYHLSQQVFGVPQSLLWQKAIEEPVLQFAELKEMYWWQRGVKDRADARPVRRWLGNLYIAWHFFVNPWYSLPIVLLAFQLKDRQLIVGGGIMTCALTASVLYPFFFAHYIAAYSCVISFLILRGMMTLYQWSFRGRDVGPPVVMFLMLGGSLMSLRIIPPKAILGLSHNARQVPFRVQVSDRLMRFGGRHVVFVRYSPHHDFHDEWVYNAADVDASPIVWCRTSDRTNDNEVTLYYKDRHFWIADVGTHTVRVSRYQPGLQLSVPKDYPVGESQDWVLKSPLL